MKNEIDELKLMDEKENTLRVLDHLIDTSDYVVDTIHLKRVRDYVEKSIPMDMMSLFAPTPIYLTKWYKCGEKKPDDKSDVVVKTGVWYHACHFTKDNGFEQLNERCWFETISPKDDDEWMYIPKSEGVES